MIPMNLDETGSSFAELIARQAPNLLPNLTEKTDTDAAELTPHATTILAIIYHGGVLIAGDRRATVGLRIAHREMEKVFPADAYSALGISGSAGIGIEVARLFQLELEHYEKIEGSLLSLDGKANRLAALLKSNLGMAMRGFVVVPMFVGFDLDKGIGRIFSYDAIGGRYEEHDYHQTGSGSPHAKGALKKLWRPDLSKDQAIAIAVEALFDAADDDAGTGGPDHVRKIYPIVATIDHDGYVRASEDQLAQITNQIVVNRGEFEDAARASRGRYLGAIAGLPPVEITPPENLMPLDPSHRASQNDAANTEGANR